MSKQGDFVISLDFELYWGVRDARSLDSYGQNILGVREVIPRMLDVFERDGIACTWATVGFLFFDEKEELLASLPHPQPRYADKRYDPYSHLDTVGANERTDPYHFGRSLVRRIAACPRQEVATHTFSHYYCLEPGQDAVSFDADLRAARAAAGRLGIQVRSIVFPRNQYSEAYLDVCRANGLTAFRGNQSAWIYKARSHGDQGRSVRALRLLDAYLPISGDHAFFPQQIRGMWNIPASRFLRPYSAQLRRLERLRLQRIMRAMEAAAKTGSAFHLWWHPHNFGMHTVQNLRNLQTIIEHYRQLRDRYGMRSSGMHELAMRAALTA